MTLPAIIPAEFFFADDATAGRVDVNCGGSDTVVLDVGIVLELGFSTSCIALSNEVNAMVCVSPSNEVLVVPVQGDP